MGASTNIDSTGLAKDATHEQITEEYATAVSEAQYDSGHGGYSGTISESDGLSIRTDLVFEDIDAAWRDVEDFTEKWGPAVAIIVGDEIYLAGCYSS